MYLFTHMHIDLDMLWSMLFSITQQSSLCCSSHVPQSKGPFPIFTLLKHIWHCRPSLLFETLFLKFLLIKTLPFSLLEIFLCLLQFTMKCWRSPRSQSVALFFNKIVSLYRRACLFPWLQRLQISICCSNASSTPWTFISLLMTLHRYWKGTSNSPCPKVVLFSTPPPLTQSHWPSSGQIALSSLLLPKLALAWWLRVLALDPSFMLLKPSLITY